MGTYTTTTYTAVSLSTSTVYASCYSGTHTILCTGRKKGLRQKRKIADDLMTPEEGLQSSQAEGGKEGDDAVLSNDDRLNFTVWTTTKTTTSVTVMYTNTASTIRISYYCVAGGINLPNACAGNG